MKTGFIGLGRMGSAMAANLVKAGHDVTVYNRNPEKSRSLLELGAHQATSIAGACSGEAVITMLADDTAVSDIALTNGGIVGKLRQGAIHISMSTISVGLSKELALAHAKAGQRFVAAPVFGRPDAAAAAKLFIVNAGDPVAVAACQPLFAAMGQKTFSMGAEPAAANLVKLTGNFMLASAIEALGEAIALVGKAGVDRQAFVDLLASSIFPAPAYANYGGAIAGNKVQPGGRISTHAHAARQPSARPISPTPRSRRQRARLGGDRRPRDAGRKRGYAPALASCPITARRDTGFPLRLQSTSSWAWRLHRPPCCCDPHRKARASTPWPRPRHRRGRT